MVQMFVLNTIGAIELGRLILVLAENLAKRLKQRRERDVELFRPNSRLKARLNWRLTKIAVWNERRLAAEARGEKFDEPPPMD